MVRELIVKALFTHACTPQLTHNSATMFLNFSRGEGSFDELDEDAKSDLESEGRGFEGFIRDSILDQVDDVAFYLEGGEAGDHCQLSSFVAALWFHLVTATFCNMSRLSDVASFCACILNTFSIFLRSVTANRRKEKANEDDVLGILDGPSKGHSRLAIENDKTWKVVNTMFCAGCTLRTALRTTGLKSRSGRLEP